MLKRYPIITIMLTIMLMWLVCVTIVGLTGCKSTTPVNSQEEQPMPNPNGLFYVPDVPNCEIIMDAGNVWVRRCPIPEDGIVCYVVYDSGIDCISIEE